MTIMHSLAERDTWQTSPVLTVLFLVIALSGLSVPAFAADLKVRIYERGAAAPLPGVAVCLGTPASMNQFGSALTGPDGTATFSEVPPAPLVVTASRSGYKSGQQSLVTNNMDRTLVMSLPTGGGGPVCETGSHREITDSGALSVHQLQINGGEAVTAIARVSLNHKVEGMPTHYRASENPEFTGTDWQAYTAEPGFELSAGNGRKLVYFQVRRFSDMTGANLEVLSPVMQDTITLQGN